MRRLVHTKYIIFLIAAFAVTSAQSTTEPLNPNEGEALGMPEQVFSVKMPAVTILRIRNSLVIHHTDHVDYDLMLEQIARQSKEHGAVEPR